MSNQEAKSVQRSLPKPFTHEGQFWMKAIHSWQEVIERLIYESSEIKASPIVTAEVARIAGELSLLAERLTPLHAEIQAHVNRFDAVNREEPAEDAEYKKINQALYQKVITEGDLFRNLLSEMFQLEHSAYKRFLS